MGPSRASGKGLPHQDPSSPARPEVGPKDTGRGCSWQSWDLTQASHGLWVSGQGCPTSAGRDQRASSPSLPGGLVIHRVVRGARGWRGPHRNGCSCTSASWGATRHHRLSTNPALVRAPFPPQSHLSLPNSPGAPGAPTVPGPATNSSQVPPGLGKAEICTPSKSRPSRTPRRGPPLCPH